MIQSKQVIVLCLALIKLLLLTSCSKTVVRENIVSAIDSGIGLTLAENKQTQLYELKAGYIRSQYYSIPTGKVVEPPEKMAGTPPAGTLSNAANQTPELVSGIRSHSGLQDILLGMDVSESFAVGKEAVKSNAAVAMYIAMAKDPKNAEAAADAVRSLAYDEDPKVRCLNYWLKDKNNVKTLNDWYEKKYNKKLGVLEIKAKENKDARDEFFKEHTEIKCD